MATSDVTESHGAIGTPIAGLVYLTATGGTRRERAAAMGAAIRGRGMTRVAVSYSETYGFLPATYATYRLPAGSRPDPRATFPNARPV